MCCDVQNDVVMHFHPLFSLRAQLLPYGGDSQYGCVVGYDNCNTISPSQV